MLTLHPDDKNIEYRNENDLLVEVYYNGIKFTGVLKNESEHIEYRDGAAHGQLITYFETGEVREISYNENGQYLKGVKYFKNGILNTETVLAPYSYKVWNINSDLIRENNTIYYSDGQVKTIFGNGKEDGFINKTFTKSGDLMFTVLNDIWVEGKLLRKINYRDDTMFSCYFESLIEENPELANSDEKNDTHYIWMWFWNIFDMDGDRYLEIINKLMTHPSREVIGTVADIIASHKFNGYINEETMGNSECYKLIREYTVYQNEMFPNRDVKKLKFK